MSSSKTKASARLILYTDIIILPDNLCGVIEFEAVRMCIVKSIKITLTGYVSTNTDSKFNIPFPPVVGRAYKPSVDNSMSKHVQPFWTHTQDVIGDYQVMGNVFYEYYPGKHLFPFCIPLKNFPHSINDPSLSQSLFYTVSAIISINYPEPVRTNVVPYYILFNREPKYVCGQPRKLTVPTNSDIDMEINFNNTCLKIGDELSFVFHILNKSRHDLEPSLKLLVEFQNSLPVVLKKYKLETIPSKIKFLSIFKKNVSNEVNETIREVIPPGLFPTSDHPSATVKYSVLLSVKAGPKQYQLMCPIIISSEPPSNPQVLFDAINKYPVNIIDRTNDFRIPFQGIHPHPPLNIPFANGIEEVSLKDSASDRFFVDHINRTTMLTLQGVDQQPPFPYPNWRSVVLPQGYVMYYYRNKWCFINLFTNQISYVDPRPPQQRIPFYTTSTEPLDIIIKINSARGIPLIEGKEPTLSFLIDDYSTINDAQGQRHYVVKSQAPSLEPQLPIHEITLTGNTKNRMNVLIKVFQSHTFNETVYGYANIELQYLPMGVEMTDWFPLIGNGTDSLGIGEISVSVCMRNKINPQEIPICVNCVSSLTKMWYPMGKNVTVIERNEEKYGSKYRKTRPFIQQFDYEYYTPYVLPDKVTYLRLLQLN
ncbi:hypothetical protein EDI_165750 [Entamoeba dispar SAW760]|uniref:Arrestin C-terminal-like domain-containing protein n=1 Tax=Entamoeba dispar (strain ATCC PRA-260 / SAW760) TaxID=370354 RepID=B0EJJ1_ENTDS|nr:uncharacterized protein EDI_165750 [Entamoeba dispar SAW760]EDR25313.1 hypothetical protein EDI_165750 [Entamoeba dispar SAW760]|eukprot:EDR25313.1 hypothetical protein EDI_165750 [Entamoeba dispar SAW760]